MAKSKIPPALPPEPLPPADWLRQAAQRGEQSSFAAGAALAALHPLVKNSSAPAGLWRCRLALAAASTLTGLDQPSLRDHWQLRRLGDDPGPAGRVYGALRRLGQPRPLQRLPEIFQAFGLSDEATLQEICREAMGLSGAPLTIAAKSAALVLRHDNRAQGFALWLADALLARALGWDLALPLLPNHVKRADCRQALDAPEIWEKTIAAALAKGALEAHGLYLDLFRRMAKLQNIAPKLRGKDAQEAIKQLLAEDAMAAQAGRQSSDRAARRLFDRLVEFQVVRELTGRASFRLYGL